MKFTSIVTALALAASTTALKAQELSLAYFMGPKHPMNAAVFTPFADKLAELSGGQLTVKQFPGGALNSVPPKQYAILLDGVADLLTLAWCILIGLFDSNSSTHRLTTLHLSTEYRKKTFDYVLQPKHN